MLLFVVLLTYLAGCASAASWLVVNTTLDTNNPATGYFSPFLGNDNSRLWPRDSRGVSSIPCCFKDRQSKDAIENYIWRARQIWYRKLGEPGARSGHALILQPPIDKFCYSSEGVWNKDVPGFYLELRAGPGMGRASFATFGYLQEGQDGRHMLEVNCIGESLCEVKIAHELGHVFGFHHEHQRFDRDNWLQFNCVDLYGWAEAWEKAKRDGVTREQLCNDEDIAQRYNFMSWAYHKVEGFASTAYDYNSIMHYTSEMAGDPDLISNDPNNPDFYPIVRIDKANGQIRKSIIPPWKPWPEFQISDLDEAGIKKMYPWQGPAQVAVAEASTMLTVAVPKET